MDESLDPLKARLRRQVQAQRRDLAPAGRTALSAKLCSDLRERSVWRAANSVLLFAPLPDEPDVWPLLRIALAAGKTVALPAFISGTNAYTARRLLDPDRDVVHGKFNIREPAATCPEQPLNRLDLVLVPGIAFDPRGGRLGRGRGYYDRLLAAVNGLKCGVAFDEQIVDAVPVGPMDVRLNCILTPTRWIET